MERRHVKINDTNMSWFSWLWGPAPHAPPTPHTPPPHAPSPETYDVILLVNLHGLTSLTTSDIKTCELLPMPEGMRSTFLEATPCGVTNLSYAGYWKTMVKIMMTELDSPTKQFAETCQYHFRKEKKKFLDKVDFLDVASEEEMAAFRRNKGWDIVECTTEYVNKRYEEDPDPLMDLNEVIILYSAHPEFPVGSITDVRSRKSLLHYLHKEGVRNPLIIDISCSGVIGTPTAARFAARTEKNRKRKGGRLTKRPKVKKLIHFA